MICYLLFINILLMDVLVFTTSHGKKYIYCGCYTTKLAQKFTFDEFLNMSDFRHLSCKRVLKKPQNNVLMNLSLIDI